VKPKAGKGTPKKGAAVPANTAALDDATKFKNAKAKALEDAHIRELKARADGEVNEAEAHKALVNYNRALFEKIREVDPSVGDYAGKVEQAMAKRLGAEKTKE
jgi:G:T/U-mismatch repair DNA glycosylase